MKSKIPYYFIALIVTFMLCDVAFVTLAKFTYTGVYTDNHYKKGMDFNRIYSSEVYKGNTSWKSHIYLDGKNVQEVIELNMPLNISHEILFQLFDSGQQPVTGAKIKGKLLRLVTDKYDTLFDFQETQAGTYIAKINIPLKGQWQLRIKASSEDKEFITTAKIINSTS